jgi:peptidoglycan L-alanyl-D-glutamate endopeptidase CwlK
MKTAAAAEGVPVEWGGDWRSFFDGPHFQLPWASYPA